MRVWGRVYNENGTYQWVPVTTDSNGHNGAVYLTTLVQTLKLNLGESPFFANLGIPQQQTIMSQIFPDFYVARIQRFFSPFFAYLNISRVPGTSPPHYNVNAMTKQGAILGTTIPS